MYTRRGFKIMYVFGEMENKWYYQLSFKIEKKNMFMWGFIIFNEFKKKFI